MKKKAPFLVIGVFLVLGLAILLYPGISSWYNEQYQIRAVVEYDRTVEKLTDAAIEEELARARAYNLALTELPLGDPFAHGESDLPEGYASILDTAGGVMGSIEIPPIGVNLPIYHGTGTAVLEKGVGHMEMTAFPIGGEGNHTVLTGHTGLPNAELFTHLAELAESDVFYIHIYKQTFAYRVDQISVVLPSETALLRPEDNKDYVSLVTCTPYGVNSHRLLVRGVRISDTQSAPLRAQTPANDADNGVAHIGFLVVLAALGVGLAVLICVIKLIHRQRIRR